MWMKLGMEDLHQMMSSISDFSEKRLSKGRTFPMAGNKTAFTPVP
jgi:hypothetical protein